MIRAAKYLGVTPWDLAIRPAYWLHVALAAEQAEQAASKSKRSHDPVPGGAKGR